MLTSAQLGIHGQGVSVNVRRRPIVHHVDIHLDVAGVLGLLGPNGAGKTTLMRALATALPIHDGKLALLGHDVSDAKSLQLVRSQLGYSPQTPLVLRHLSTFDQVAYAAWLKGLSAAAGQARARQVLNDVDLAHKSATKTRHLSGGMLRRLGIAMALVSDPKLVLLDEPTAGLDPEQRLRFHELIKRLSHDRAIVLSTHLVEDVATLCSTVTVIAGGRSVFAGTPMELAARADGSKGDAAGIAAGFATVTGMKV